MKLLLFLALFCFACGTTNNSTTNNRNASTEQVFLAGSSNKLPGKCYVKMKLGNETPFTESICHDRVTKSLVKQIQADLVRLGFSIDGDEIDKGEFGTTTKTAIKSFQQKNNMAYGALDWATVNRLKL